MLLAILTFAAMLHAQERFGAVAGVVRDATGGALPGVTVSLTNSSTNRTRIVVADEAGRYRATDLEPGRYTVRFELPGFTPSEFPDVAVLLGRTADVDATLEIAGVVQTLTVTPNSPQIVDLRSTTTAHDVMAEEFDLLPKTRSFQSIAATAPSVNAGVIEDGIQVNGASGAENTFTIDGVVTSSLFDGRSRQDAAFEYLQEVQVKTAGIPAEYGGAMGGVISAVTKSGGNTVHGEAHTYFDGSPLNAGPPPRLVLSPIDDRTVSYVQDAKQPDHRSELGGSIGGPMIKNRLFYFASASPRFVHATTNYGYLNGADQGPIGQQQILTQAFGKVSYSRNRLSAYGSVLFTRTDATGTFAAYNGTLPNSISSSRAGNAANINRGFVTGETNVSGSLNLTLSGSSLVAIRGGHFSDGYRDVGVSSTTSVAYQTSNIGMAGVPASLQGPIGTQTTPRAAITSHDDTTRTFVSADYNATFTAAGFHALKAGGGVERTANDAQAAYPGGYVLVYWDRTFSFGGSTGRGTYGYYEVNDRGFGGMAASNTVSLFVQDQWTVTPRLTLNLGVRAENENVPTYRPDLKQYGLQFGFADKIAPRLSASYDLTDRGRAKIYVAWGRYYDWTKLALARDSFGSDFWKIYYRGLDTLDVSSLSLSNMPGADLWIVPGSYRDQRVPNFDRVDPNIKPTFQDSTSGGFEMQLGPAGVFNVRYVHNNLANVVEDVGALVNGNTVLSITNPGEGAGATMATTGATRPFATPKVTRLFDALEIGYDRRLSNRWFASASYTYSRLYGNYAGLASSDEIRTPTTGASYKAMQQQAGAIANPGGAARSNWNIDEVMWDSHGHLNILGRLATDRPHVVKLHGAYTFRSGTDVGVYFYGASGTPISTYVNTTNQAEVFVNGRGDLGRTPVLTQTNLLVSHGVSLRGQRHLRVGLNVLNVFNQKTPRHVFNWLNRGAGTPRASSAIDLTRTNLAYGYDYNALILASPDRANAYDPRYGLTDLFSDGLQAQIMIRLTF